MKPAWLVSRNDPIRWRIALAASLVGLLVCVALLALWRRSHTFKDTLRGPISSTATIWIESDKGWLVFSAPWPSGGARHWSIRKTTIDLRNTVGYGSDQYKQPLWPIRVGTEGRLIIVHVPYATPLLLTVFAIAASWINWRFTLRGMLIFVGVIGLLLLVARYWVKSQLV